MVPIQSHDAIRFVEPHAEQHAGTERNIPAKDVVEGYVSAQAAASEYGVVVDLQAGKADLAPTAELRRAGARRKDAAEPGIYEPANTPIPIPG